MHPPSGPLGKALAAVARPRRPTDNERVRIGLAWHVESRGGREVVWHNGMTGGYSAFIAFTADGERGAVVLTNVAQRAPDGSVSSVVLHQGGRDVKGPRQSE